jgi:hypothetical protein
MSFRNARPFISTAVFGAALLATALTCAARNSGADPVFEQTQSCIRTQFLENGYHIVSDGPDAVGARISGQRNDSPPVTVFFRKEMPLGIRLGDSGGRFALQPSLNQFASIKNLTDGIAGRCLDRIGVERRRNVSNGRNQPS